jgi:hypothetical protein
MRTIVDIGRQGADFVGAAAPQPHIALEGAQRFTPIIDRFPTTTIQGEVSDGTKRSIEAHTLLLNNRQVFGLVWEMAAYEPIVYARQGDRAVMGMLSPNFDGNGAQRLPSIKILPLKTPYPLISRGTDLLPDAQMAIMLAGSAHLEGQGGGGHDIPPEQDYEHKFAFIGAVSLGKDTIIENGQHIQHAERTRTSVATGLTNGAVGDIFVPDGDRTGGFTGYGMPVTFHQETIQPADAIFFPKGFLHNQDAYGAYYADATQIAYGASLQIMYQRQGQQAVSDQLQQITRVA